MYEGGDGGGRRQGQREWAKRNRPTDVTKMGGRGKERGSDSILFFFFLVRVYGDKQSAV